MKSSIHVQPEHAIHNICQFLTLMIRKTIVICPLKLLLKRSGKNQVFLHVINLSPTIISYR